MHSDLRLWTPSMQGAADGLDALLRLEAYAWQKKLGFGYVPSVLAPNTFAAAKAEFKLASLSPHGFYRVSRDHSSKTIFRTEQANWALRYVHDMVHIELDADFSLEGERRVAMEQLRVITDFYGVPVGSLIWRLLRIDTLGQNECMHAIGRFPADQRRFAAIALRKGVKVAIELERKFGGIEPPPDGGGIGLSGIAA